jgi:Cu/Zn superoxide dismutase
MLSTPATMLLLLLLLLGSSYGQQHNGAVGPDTPPAQLRLPPAFKRALVEMVPGNFNVSGALLLLESASGLFVTGFLYGLRPGPHAMHVHEFGRVGDKCAAAGGHFNPDNTTGGHSHGTAAAPGQQVGRGDVARPPHTSQRSAAVMNQHAGHSDRAAPGQQDNQSGTVAPASGGVAALAQNAGCRCGMAAGRHGGQGATPGQHGGQGAAPGQHGGQGAALGQHGGQGAAPGQHGGQGAAPVQHAGHGGVAAQVEDVGCRCDGAVAGGPSSGGAAQHVGHSSVGVLVQQAGAGNIAIVLQPTAGNSSVAAPQGQHSSHSSGAAGSQHAGRTGETVPGQTDTAQHAGHGNGGTPGRHAGDLGYVVTPASGPTLVYRYDEKLRLGGGGRYDVSGLTVIVHENVAGEPRAACGIIRCLNC